MRRSRTPQRLKETALKRNINFQNFSLWKSSSSVLCFVNANAKSNKNLKLLIISLSFGRFTNEIETMKVGFKCVTTMQNLFSGRWKYSKSKRKNKTNIHSDYNSLFSGLETYLINIYVDKWSWVKNMLKNFWCLKK